MKKAVKEYPDISESIKKKARHRRTLAALSFEKKIEIIFKLQVRAKFIKSGRVVRKRDNIGDQKRGAHGVTPLRFSERRRSFCMGAIAVRVPDLWFRSINKSHRLTLDSASKPIRESR